jgi:hypothetical protein
MKISSSVRIRRLVNIGCANECLSMNTLRRALPILATDFSPTSHTRPRTRPYTLSPSGSMGITIIWSTFAVDYGCVRPRILLFGACILRWLSERRCVSRISNVWRENDCCTASLSLCRMLMKCIGYAMCTTFKQSAQLCALISHCTTQMTSFMSP